MDAYQRQPSGLDWTQARLLVSSFGLVLAWIGFGWAWASAKQILSILPGVAESFSIGNFFSLAQSLLLLASTMLDAAPGLALCILGPWLMRSRSACVYRLVWRFVH